MRWAQNGVVLVGRTPIGWESGKSARQRHRVSRSSSSPARVQFDYPILVRQLSFVFSIQFCRYISEI
jgi:hypothetical protein